MADSIYNSFKEFLTDGIINLETDTFKLALCGSTYVPSSVHTHLADITQTSGTGYSDGGATLGSPTTTLSGGVVKWDTDDAVWSEASFTARWGVIYSDTASGDALVCCLDFTENKTVTSGTFTVTMNAAGILNLS